MTDWREIANDLNMSTEEKKAVMEWIDSQVERLTGVITRLEEHNELKGIVGYTANIENINGRIIGLLEAKDALRLIHYDSYEESEI